MQWFSGDIAAAINLAKSKSAIFVVYCEGNDESSKQFTALINDARVSSKLQSESFVAIRIESDKPEYIQFCNIYRIVPVPSLFFIQNGIPIKVVTNAVKTSDELLEAIEGVTGSSNITTTPIAAEAKTTTTKEPEIVCDGDKCYKKESEPAATATSDEASSSSSSPKVEEETEEEKQEKIKRAMKLIEEKRIERVKEEQKLEKEREIRRRQDGQEVQKLRQWQDEQEMIKLQDERKREKMAATEARQRVLRQIEEDKKERARRFNPTPENEEPVKKAEPVKQTATTPTIPPNSARIQFKKPDGESEIVTFDSDIPFADVHAFVQSDLLAGSSVKEFTLATTFPRHEFTEEEFNKTLIDLKLAPASVLLIIPGRKKTAASAGNKSSSSVLPTASNGSFFDMMSTIFMSFFTPVLAFFVYLKNLAFRPRGDSNAADVGSGDNEDYGKRKRDEETLTPNDAAKRRNMDRYNAVVNNEASTSSDQQQQQFGAIPKSGTYKRINPSSNIHRLHQDSDTDEEERKTYNGNSTQQM